MVVIDAEARALAVFKDPATGEPRLACAAGKQVRIFDPVAGGEALLVLDAGGHVFAPVVFEDPATGALRLVCGTSTDNWESGDVRVFDPLVGGDALLVIDVGNKVNALEVFKDPATGAPRLA